MSVPSNIKVIDSAGGDNASGTNTVLSSWIDTQQYSVINIEVQTTGTPQGVLTAEGTNQFDPATPHRPRPGVVPIPLPSEFMIPPLPAIGGNPVAYQGNVSGGPRFIRYKYVNATGTGAIDAWINATGV